MKTTCEFCTINQNCEVCTRKFHSTFRLSDLISSVKISDNANQEIVRAILEHDPGKRGKKSES